MSNFKVSVHISVLLTRLILSHSDQLNVFVFSLIAPFVLPIIEQVKTELNTGSSEIIESSQAKQHIVFHDDTSSDPTHSMLSKDHFSNILNEPAGKIASQVLKWVVPQLIKCWDDERIDVNRTLDRVINGVFHHPALRGYGEDGALDGRGLIFGIVEQWWGDKDEQEREQLRDQLSRDGVEQGRNHKEGVHDTGHGCGKPLGMPTLATASSSGAIGGPAASAVLGGISDALAGKSQYDSGYAGKSSDGNPSAAVGKLAGEAVGGGLLGGVVGGIVGGIGGDLLGDAFGGSGSDKKSYKKEHYGADGSYTQSATETGHRQVGGQQRYGQAQYSQTDYSGGGQRQEYQRYEQGGGYGHSQRVFEESRPTYGGGYERTTETRFDQSGGGYQSEVRREGRDARGEYYENNNRYEGRFNRDDDDDKDSDEEKKRKKHHKKHHSRDDDDDDDNDSHRRGDGEQRSYGEQQSYNESREYGESRSEYEPSGYGGGHRHGAGDDDQSERRRYGGHGRVGDDDKFDRPTYTNNRYGGGDENSEDQPRYGGGRPRGDEYESEQPRYGGRGEVGYGREEPTEEYGEDRGYGQGDDDENNERRRYGGERY